VNAKGFVGCSPFLQEKMQPCYNQELLSDEGSLPVALKPTSIIAIYPGSFDPITNGHLDLIERGARLVGRLVVAVLRNEKKQPLFSVNERMEMLREVVSGIPNVEVDFFDGLLVDYATQKKATLIFRGIRAISDYEHELQMALMNRRLRPDIDTVFMMSGEAHSFISSHLVKEVIRLGGNIAGLVPPAVETRLRDRIFGENAKQCKPLLI
jgi:pantetheine-phosphate adenylyltransferase